MTGDHQETAEEDPPAEPQIPIPPGLSDREAEMYRAGFQMCATMVQRATSSWTDALAGEQIQSADDGDGGDEVETCDDCGSELRQGLGGTTVCPNQECPSQ